MHLSVRKTVVRSPKRIVPPRPFDSTECSGMSITICKCKRIIKNSQKIIKKEPAAIHWDSCWIQSNWLLWFPTHCGQIRSLHTASRDTPKVTYLKFFRFAKARSQIPTNFMKKNIRVFVWIPRKIDFHLDSKESWRNTSLSILFFTPWILFPYSSHIFWHIKTKLS